MTTERRPASTHNFVSEATLPSQVYKATYSGVPVWEFRVKGVAVMRRKNDDWLNATQILKVANFDKPHRTRILERDVQRGEHEKVQGGYGKYQGVDLAQRYKVRELLRPLIDFSPSSESPPLAPKHVTAASARPKKAREPKQQKAKSIKTRSSKKGKGKTNELVEELILFDTDLQSNNNETVSIASSNNITASPTISPIMYDTTEFDEHYNSPTNPRKRTSSLDNNTRQAKMSKLSMAESVLATSSSPSFSTPMSAANQFIEVLLAYFTSNSNLIPSFVISPPPDFDANLVIDAQGHTSLHWAAAMANIDMVALLIKAGADTECVNIIGETALMRSVMFPYNYQNGSFNDIAQLLASSIGNIDSCDQTVFHHIALFANNDDMQEGPAKYYLKTLISHLNQSPNERYRKSILNRQNTDGDTAINILAKAKNREFVKLLFCAGGDLYICNKENKNAEHYFCEIDTNYSPTITYQHNSYSRQQTPINLQSSSSSNISNGTSFGHVIESPLITANNKVYAVAPTIDSFVSIGKKILEDYCSPYISELESKDNELFLCNNKLKSIEDEIKSANLKVKEMKEINKKLPEKKERVQGLIKLIKEKIEKRNQQRLDSLLTEELNKTSSSPKNNVEINERQKEEVKKQLDVIIEERKELTETLITGRYLDFAFIFIALELLVLVSQKTLNNDAPDVDNEGQFIII
ncbi:9225_t:CDS:2 [Entrophospora sp. SA101]|nr:9222_t:CDS:2 [Entrophospora sp. SA101]CAJ0754893.1 9225_t:CDS:2 [Entrophospora sp. SA101]CAJ0891153.1 12609_t:CDS:2 [Entrophospora sp. SA101]